MDLIQELRYTLCSLLLLFKPHSQRTAHNFHFFLLLKTPFYCFCNFLSTPFLSCCSFVCLYYPAISSGLYKRDRPSKRCSLTVMDDTHFGLHHYSEIACLFSTAHTSYTKKCLHIQFADIPYFHALAPFPLPKIMYL